MQEKTVTIKTVQNGYLLRLEGGNIDKSFVYETIVETLHEVGIWLLRDSGYRVEVTKDGE